MSANWQNRTIWTGDNLNVMRGMNNAAVDLIYLDPPFNSKANYAAPTGSQAAGIEFKDTWTLADVDAEWINLMEAKHPNLHRVMLAAMTPSDKSYLAYMAVRILEMWRILKPTGAIYLHCDPTMSHYLKLVMDAIFGSANFINEIIWHYTTGGASKRHYSKKHDVLLFYSKTKSYNFYPENIPIPRTEEVLRRIKSGVSGATRATTETKLPMDVWSDIKALNPMAKERLGYPTQKPLALMARIIMASSDEGDMVLDPFCGCATALIQADALNRKWVGIDISPKAADLVIRRNNDLTRTLIHRNDIPQRIDLGKIIRYDHPDNKKTLYGEQLGKCAGCGEHFQARNLEVDHIISRKKGGSDHIQNLQLLCGACNRIKGDRGMEYLKVKLQL